MERVQKMSVSPQFTKVWEKIGTVFFRVSDLVSDYLDLELSSSVTWRGKFVRRFNIKTDTPFSNGDLIRSSIDSGEFLISNLQSDLLLNESIYKTGELYRCNVSGEIKYFNSGERSATSYKVAGSWAVLHSGESFCLVPTRIDYSERDPVPNVVHELYMYAPNSLGIQNDFRVTIANPTTQNYRVKTVDNLSLEGLSVVGLETDQR